MCTVDSKSGGIQNLERRDPILGCLLTFSALFQQVHARRQLSNAPHRLWKMNMYSQGSASNESATVRTPNLLAHFARHSAHSPSGDFCSAAMSADPRKNLSFQGPRCWPRTATSTTSSMQRHLNAQGDANVGSPYCSCSSPRAVFQLCTAVETNCTTNRRASSVLATART